MIHNVPINLIHHLRERSLRQFGGKYIKNDAGVAFPNLVAHTENG